MGKLLQEISDSTRLDEAKAGFDRPLNQLQDNLGKIQKLTRRGGDLEKQLVGVNPSFRKELAVINKLLAAVSERATSLQGNAQQSLQALLKSEGKEE